MSVPSLCFYDKCVCVVYRSCCTHGPFERHHTIAISQNNRTIQDVYVVYLTRFIMYLPPDTFRTVILMQNERDKTERNAYIQTSPPPPKAKPFTFTEWDGLLAVCANSVCCIPTLCSMLQHLLHEYTLSLSRHLC